MLSASICVRGEYFKNIVAANSLSNVEQVMRAGESNNIIIHYCLRCGSRVGRTRREALDTTTAAPRLKELAGKSGWMKWEPNLAGGGLSLQWGEEVTACGG